MAQDENERGGSTPGVTVRRRGSGGGRRKEEGIGAGARGRQGDRGREVEGSYSGRKRRDLSNAGGGGFLMTCSLLSSPPLPGWTKGFPVPRGESSRGSVGQEDKLCCRVPPLAREPPSNCFCSHGCLCFHFFLLYCTNFYIFIF